ncbi:FkbM family methyltransferase [Candidatus Pelagibacter sp. HIMB1321]|uniref:FkbM family methyltransferase n=1 Tax=Candidatus Pelagibacter sp. HIMB1321 TaxID=1388755 RepID=UPI0012EDC2A5|nr:FkbM family methyltransferase [Candidatus Pelagibacter sp. HIMB1321]
MEDSYQFVKIQKKKIKLFTPNHLTEWRVDTLYTKEPETLAWIDKFDPQDKNFIFWDIGSNIGLYSIYASITHPRCQVISFEPSTNNLRVLSRNISINNLEKSIKIFTNPLTDNSKKFLMMQHNEFNEGGALNSFGANHNFEGKKFSFPMKYQLFGFSIKDILDNKFLEIPDYIKIDVDGIEHLILSGAGEYLKNEKIKSVSVEINENFSQQFENVIDIMKKNNFVFIDKKQNNELKNSNGPFSKSFNYIFNKKN